MSLYLTRFSYTSETWNAMIERPEDRRDMARTIIESVGGKLHGFWYAFGQYDGYTFWEALDNVKMASVALALSSRGAIKSQETVVLLTVEETLEALRGAAQVPLSPSGSKGLVSRVRGSLQGNSDAMVVRLRANQ